MSKLWEIAPPGTWAILILASIFLMTGFVLLSHTLVRRDAYGDRWSGLLSAGLLEMTVRLGAAALLSGLALWAIQLDAPVWVATGLSVLALTGAGLEGAARLRVKS